MAIQVILLLLASSLLLITGDQLDKEIAALRIKIEKQDAALRWLENVTQTQNEKIAFLNEQLQQGLEDHDLQIDMMQNESDSQQDKLEKLQENFDIKIDMMQNTSNIQEEQLENLTAEYRKLHDGDSLLQQQILNQTDTLNAKLQNVTNELNAKLQDGTDSQQKQIHNLTEINRNMWKYIQKNHNDTSELNNTINDQLQDHQNRIHSNENRINSINNQLDYGGRRIWGTHKSISYSSLQHRDLIRLEFMGAGARGWLSCTDSVCDLRSCPYNGNNIKNFNSCHGELFRIVVQNGGSVESGELVYFQYVTWGNHWLGCPHNNRCDKRPCPGSLSNAANTVGYCKGETFRIYARGRAVGQTIYNGDLVMIHLPGFGSKYISIQGSSEGSDTSMNYCPGSTPPAYLSYSFCSNNVFRVYKKT